MRTRRAKYMRADPDYLPSVRNPPSKGLLNHANQCAAKKQLARHPAEGLEFAVGVEAEDASVAAHAAHFEAAEGGVDVGGQ